VAESKELLTWLRATAEPTRLRLLALCAGRELSVSDLAAVLGQSEPRVSRHLRILTEAGLIERVRQGQWVHYRPAQDTPAAGFLRGLLGQLDRADPTLVRDRERALAPGAAALASPACSRLGRELCAVVEADPVPRPASVLLVGVEHPELFAAIAAFGGECAAIAHSRRAAQAARAVLEREGLACRVLLAAGPDALGPRDLDRLGRTAFDLVVLDHLAAAQDALPALLAAVRRVLPDTGGLWLFEPYEALDSARQRVVEHPIARLRRRLAEAGFSCERIRPIEAGRHVLAVRAAPSAAPLSRTG
jgi:ArsR family transcriptional regulator